MNTTVAAVIRELAHPAARRDVKNYLREGFAGMPREIGLLHRTHAKVRPSTIAVVAGAAAMAGTVGGVALGWHVSTAFCGGTATGITLLSGVICRAAQRSYDLLRNTIRVPGDTGRSLRRGIREQRRTLRRDRLNLGRFEHATRAVRLLEDSARTQPSRPAPAARRLYAEVSHTVKRVNDRLDSYLRSSQAVEDSTKELMGDDIGVLDLTNVLYVVYTRVEGGEVRYLKRGSSLNRGGSEEIALSLLLRRYTAAVAADGHRLLVYGPRWLHSLLEEHGQGVSAAATLHAEDLEAAVVLWASGSDGVFSDIPDLAYAAGNL